MLKLMLLNLCLLATVSAQGPRDYTGRRPGGSITGGILDEVIPGNILRPGDIIDRGFTRDDCYRNEVPSYDRYGYIDRCSYRNRYCEDPSARCRITRGRRGTCCRPRQTGYCRNGSRGRGSCHSDRDCRRQFGSRYDCQFGRRGGYGKCCLRFNPRIPF